MDLKIGYCPICDQTIKAFSYLNSCECPDCGHHIALHKTYENKERQGMDLKYELRKCTECSCSRCNLCGTEGCYVEIAIKELDRYEQAMDSLEKFKEEK
jgi:hypothetical protein